MRSFLLLMHRTSDSSELFCVGGPGYTMFTSYSGALLVAGGSGVTFILSVLEDILQKHAEGRSRLRVIEVVWSVSDPGTFLPFGLFFHFSELQSSFIC